MSFRKDLSKMEIALRGLGIVLVVGLVFYLATIGITGIIANIGAYITQSGLNVYYLGNGVYVHIHKSLVGLGLIIGSLYGLHVFDNGSHERLEKWMLYVLLLIGILIVAYDYTAFGVILPIDVY
jgi:hypothetical protein